MSFRHHFHHLSDIYHGEAEMKWKRDWRFILAAVLLTILTGFLLPAAWWLQRWCAGSAWDHEDRWAGTKQFAITLLLFIYVPLMFNLLFFHVPLMPWPHFSHTPAWFNGLVCIWYMVVGWFFLLPLVPTLALIVERIDPRTPYLERVLLPSEHPPLPQPSAPLKKAGVTKPVRKKAVPSGRSAKPKKRNKGRARPLGELLLEEKAARDQQGQEVQQISPAEISAPPSTLSSDLLPPGKPDKENREALEELF